MPLPLQNVRKCREPSIIPRNVCRAYTRRSLQVRNPLSKRSFLVDTSVELSLSSPSAIDHGKTPNLNLLKATNGSRVAVYSHRTLTLSLGLRREFSGVSLSPSYSFICEGLTFRQIWSSGWYEERQAYWQDHRSLIVWDALQLLARVCISDHRTRRPIWGHPTWVSHAHESQYEVASHSFIMLHTTSKLKTLLHSTNCDAPFPKKEKL